MFQSCLKFNRIKIHFSRNNALIYFRGFKLLIKEIYLAYQKKLFSFSTVFLSLNRKLAVWKFKVFRYIYVIAQLPGLTILAWVNTYLKYRVFTGPFFSNHFFHTKIFLDVIYNIYNRYSSISVLTDLKIFKENVYIGKLVAKIPANKPYGINYEYFFLISGGFLILNEHKFDTSGYRHIHMHYL